MNCRRRPRVVSGASEASEATVTGHAVRAAATAATGAIGDDGETEAGGGRPEAGGLERRQTPSALAAERRRSAAKPVAYRLSPIAYRLSPIAWSPKA